MRMQRIVGILSVCISEPAAVQYAGRYPARLDIQIKCKEVARKGKNA